MTQEFGAPWGKAVLGMTLFGTIVLIGLPAFSIIRGLAAGSSFYVMVGVPLVLFAGCLLFTIRGYSISNGALFVKRLLWANRIELSRLRDAKVNPEAMAKSIRTFGNGGLFSFSGRFRNSELGAYRAFAMDPKKSVVLRFPDKTFVVTPDRPEEFVNVLKSVTAFE